MDMDKENADALNIRLKVFMDSTGLNNSQFADRCGLPRPSFSQLLSGRNKKVSDVVLTRIHDAFPQLNMLWLRGLRFLTYRAPGEADWVAGSSPRWVTVNIVRVPTR